jgi:hypothetical protein
MLLNKKSNIVAVGGIATGLAFLLLFFTGMFQFSKLAFCFCTSVICGVLIVAYGYKTAVIHYIAVALLSLLFVANKSVAVLYAVIFGNYPLIRFFTDGIKKSIIKNVIKFIVFNIYIVVLYLIATLVIKVDFAQIFRYSVWILWIGMIGLLCLYDYIYMPFVRRVYSLLNK